MGLYVLVTRLTMKPYTTFLLQFRKGVTVHLVFTKIIFTLIIVIFITSCEKNNN